MKDASRTGLLFLVYTATPSSIISTYSYQILILGNKGTFLCWGMFFHNSLFK